MKLALRARLVWWVRHLRHRLQREESGLGALGVVRDEHDPRDYPYRIFAGVAAGALPPVVDLRGQQSPVRDQQAWNSCVAHALTSSMEYLEAKGLGPVSLPPLDVPRLAPMFVWFEGRAVEGNIGQNVGMGLRDAAQTLVDKGAPLESAWPYDAAHLDEAPTAAALENAAARKVTLYARVNNLTELKQCLADGYPVVLSFLVYVQSLGPQGDVTAPAGQPFGWHAVLAVGYDDALGRVAFKNSWGTGWGLAGYGTLPYSYFEDPSLIGDLWCIRTEEVPDRDAIVAAWVAQEVAAANTTLMAALQQSEKGREALARAQQAIAESQAAMERARAATGTE